jgi:hypothetical protein
MSRAQSRLLTHTDEGRFVGPTGSYPETGFLEARQIGNDKSASL